jgi:RHS repeat-associated protein
LTYNSNHEVLSVTYPRGNSTEYTYDTSGNHLANGNVLEVRRKVGSAGGSASDIVTTYTYEPNFQFVATATDARSHTTSYDYDANGNLLEVETPTIDAYDSNFNVIDYEITTTATYNGSGQVLTMTDGEGNVTKFEYFTSGANIDFLKRQIVDDGGLNLTTEYEYNRAGLLTASWSPRAFEVGASANDFKTEYTVNELNQTTRVVGRSLFESGSTYVGPRAESYSLFDLNGNLEHSFTKYVTWDGNEPSQPSDPHDHTTFPKSVGPMMATWIQRSTAFNLLNYATSTTVDSRATGHVVTQLTSTYTYDKNYNVVRTTSPLGIHNDTVFDERELVFQRIAAADSPDPDAEGTFRSDYDDNGSLISSFDALDNETTYLYDSFDRRIRVTDPLGHYRTTEYDANSNVVKSSAFSSTDVLLAETEYEHDEINRTSKTTRLAKNMFGGNIGSGEAITRVALDKNSRAFKTQGPTGIERSTFFDGANRVTHTIDALDNRINYTYNAEGTALSTEYREVNGLNPSIIEISHSEVDVDPMNRVVRSRDQRYDPMDMDTEVHFHFDSLGRTPRTVDASGTVTETMFDLLSRTTLVTRVPYGTGTTDRFIITHFAYDADSRNTFRTIFRDGLAMNQPQTTEYTYDDRGRVIELRRPDNSLFEFHYNAQNRTGWEDPMGTVVVDTHDDRNQVVERNISRGSGVLGVTKETYEYDALRRMTKGANFESSDMHTELTYSYNTLSLPERLISEMHDGWGKDHTSDIFATFDESGFNTSHTYTSGRMIEYTPDGLNRTQTITDDYLQNTIASFTYSGFNRLIQRSFGNGTNTTIEYEDAGCGCGGFAPVVENIRHTDPYGQTFAQSERRHDVNRNVVTQRHNHLGGVGEVFRYDDTYRLTNTWEGTEMQGAAIDSLAATAPTSSFKLQRQYNLDTRGNRHDSNSTISAVTLLDVTNSLIVGDSYSPDADSNLYNTINSQTWLFDANQNETFDPTTGLYKAYDYLGRLVAEDTTSEFLEPERRYRYDVFSRLRVEEVNYKGSFWNESTTISSYCPTCEGSCAGNPGLLPLEEVRVSGHPDTPGGPGDVDWAREYVIGDTAADSLSSRVTSPWHATGSPGGGNSGGRNGVIQERVFDGEHVKMNPQEYRMIYRHENQQRSAMAFTDGDGALVAEVAYSEYGLTFQRKILALFNPKGYTEVAEDDHGKYGPVVYIEVDTMIQPLSANMEGAMARVVVPTLAPYVMHRRVMEVDDTSGFLYIEDPTGDLFTLLDEGGVLTIFGHHDAGINGSEVHTAGCWDSAPTYSSGTDTTTFTNSNGDFPDHSIGWTLQPDARHSVFFEITSISATTITVRGDARSVVPNGSWYFIIPPVGVDKETAALDPSPEAYPSRYLAFHYRYMPPMAGVSITSAQNSSVTEGIHGYQEGLNHQGQYQAWHRYYNPTTGRWTTPDPAAAPWTNLVGYVGANPLSFTDPSGLQKNIGLFFGGADNDLDSTTFIPALYHAYGGDKHHFTTRSYPNNIRANIRAAHSIVCEEYCKAVTMDCDANTYSIGSTPEIDIFGFSRGAVAAIELARRLNDVGCECTERCPLDRFICGIRIRTYYTMRVRITGIRVRFLGVIDPVSAGSLQMLGLNGRGTLPSNVANVFRAMASLASEDRSWWDAPDNPVAGDDTVDHSPPAYPEHDHSSIARDPEVMDKMADAARGVGVPLGDIDYTPPD